MSKYLILLFVLASCSLIEDPSSKFQKRKTIGVLDDELVEILTLPNSESPGEWFLVLRRENSDPEEYLTLADTLVLSKFVAENGLDYEYPQPYLRSVAWYVGNFHYGKSKLKLRVSGEIKSSHSKDHLPGPPVLLDKIE